VGIGGRFLGMMNFLHSFADNLKMWGTQNSGNLRDIQVSAGIAFLFMFNFTFTFTLYG
jgi:hypothetical protein